MPFMVATMLPSCGTKNMFITLADVSEKCTGTLTGTTRSFTLVVRRMLRSRTDSIAA